MPRGVAAGACFALLSPLWRGAALRCELQSQGKTGLIAVSNLSSSSSFQKHEFFVDMTCEGCSNAVTRVLNKLGGEWHCARPGSQRRVAKRGNELAADDDLHPSLAARCRSTRGRVSHVERESSRQASASSLLLGRGWCKVPALLPGVHSPSHGTLDQVCRCRRRLRVASTCYLGTSRRPQGACWILCIEKHAQAHQHLQV